MICDFPISLAEGEVLELCVVDQVTIQWETQAISAIQTMTEVLEGATSGGNVPGAKTTHSYQFGQSLSGRLLSLDKHRLTQKLIGDIHSKPDFFLNMIQNVRTFNRVMWFILLKASLQSASLIKRLKIHWLNQFGILSWVEITHIGEF